MTKSDREEEARAILKRLDQQSEKILGAAAPEEPSDDRIEILGRRIGKVVSVIFAVVLVIYLWHTYFMR